jgi:uncharacterized protein
MLIFIYCADRPGTAAMLARTRLRHLEYMIANRHKLAFGGVLSAPPGGSSAGRIFVLELPAMEDAEDFLASEPYYRAGLIDQAVIRAFRPMWPEPVPGTLESELRLERARQQPADGAEITDTILGVGEQS